MCTARFLANRMSGRIPLVPPRACGDPIRVVPQLIQLFLRDVDQRELFVDFKQIVKVLAIFLSSYGFRSKTIATSAVLLDH